MDYRTYPVLRAKREPLLRFVEDALEKAGCRILRVSEPNVAPFRMTFETPDGDRLGLILYAFLANSKRTKNRPDDEHRFQVKYGSDDKKVHELWQDPYQLYTTLLCGIDLERGIFVGADPVLHNPTRFFMSIEFKDEQVDEILKRGWHFWERDHRAGDDKPIEVLVGGTADTFLRYVRFEREAWGEDPGHRALLAERLTPAPASDYLSAVGSPLLLAPSSERLHALSQEFELSQIEILDVIAKARRLKMAVRGWVAEEHLYRSLVTVPGVTDCQRKDEEGGPDIHLRFDGTQLTVECKNVLRKRTAQGLPRMDFKRTRISKDPCARFYSRDDFDVVAACLHAVTEHWEFRYILPGNLEKHETCRGKLAYNVKIDERWNENAAAVLRAAVAS